MKITIQDRIIIITGPSTTGKSTLAKQIKAMSPVPTVIISHDDILDKVNPKLSEEDKNEEFFTLFLKKISETLQDQDNALIVFDVPGINDDYIFTLINLIEEINQYSDDITILKTNVPLNIHTEFMKLRYKNDINAFVYFDDFTDYYNNMLEQRKTYEGPFGTLHTDFYNYDCTVIENPQDVTLSFNFPKKLKRTK